MLENYPSSNKALAKYSNMACQTFEICFSNNV